MGRSKDDKVTLVKVTKDSTDDELREAGGRLFDQIQRTGDRDNEGAQRSTK